LPACTTPGSCDAESLLVRAGDASAALNYREDYKPGKRLSLDAGLRYGVGDNLGLMLQANASFRSHDKGEQAEPEDTAADRFSSVRA